jgi:alanine dehydrogenase
VRVGIPTEVKDHEYRVAVTPDGARELAARGHDVLVQRGAGEGAGFPDTDYEAAGCDLIDTADGLWAQAELVVKVKEPVPDEYRHLRADLALFTFLHLAGDRALTGELLQRKVTAVAYETVQDRHGRLPLLAPMSEIAGRMSAQVGASYLEKERGGCGVLIGGATGVDAARVVVIGAGMAGSSAARVAAGMGADVTVVDTDMDKLRAVEQTIMGSVATAISTSGVIARLVRDAHVVIGAALNVGARAPHLVTEEMVTTMQPGAVVVDISIDQGGCVETTRMTTHSQPTFVRHGVVHYCVGNMPGAVPRTSTLALTNVTLPYLLRLADLGIEGAARADAGLARGVNTYEGALTNEAVAEAHGREHRALANLVPPT